MKTLFILFFIGIISNVSAQEIIELETIPDSNTHVIVSIAEMAINIYEADFVEYDFVMDEIEFQLHKMIVEHAVSVGGSSYYVVSKGVRQKPNKVVVGEKDYEIHMGSEYYINAVIFQLRFDGKAAGKI